MRPSNETRAPCSTGVPVTSVVQSPLSKRCSGLHWVAPENTEAISVCEELTVFTHRTAFSLKNGLLRLERLMHTASIGGSSVTLHTALAVMPVRPAAPLVVMTLTAAPS